MLKEAANNAYVKIISYILYLETSLKRPFKGQGETGLIFLENNLTAAQKYWICESTLFQEITGACFNLPVKLELELVLTFQWVPVRGWGLGWVVLCLPWLQGIGALSPALLGSLEADPCLGCAVFQGWMCVLVWPWFGALLVARGWGVRAGQLWWLLQKGCGKGPALIRDSVRGETWEVAKNALSPPDWFSWPQADPASVDEDK